MVRSIAVGPRLPFIVPVAMILIAALVLAASVNRVVDAALSWWLPDRSPPPPPERTAPQDPIPSFSVTRVGALSGLRPAASASPPPRVEVFSELPYLVLGTLVSLKAEHSLAAMIDSRDGTAHTWRVGDVVEDGVVAEINRARVIIERAGRRELIGTARRPGAAAPARAAIAPGALTPAPPRSSSTGSASAGSASLAPTLRQTGANEWSVQRTDVAGVTSNLMQLGMDARIVPAFENGAASGFKLLSVKPGSLYTKLGLRSGDVLARVNGVSLNSLEKVMGSLGQLKEAPRIDMEVVRNGARVTHTYRVE